MTTTSTTPTIRSVDRALDLLTAAGESLSGAHMARSVTARSAGTRVAVLRAAAAVLTVRDLAGPWGHDPVDVWRLLPRVAPELTEWADFFKMGPMASGVTIWPKAEP